MEIRIVAQRTTECVVAWYLLVLLSLDMTRVNKSVAESDGESSQLDLVVSASSGHAQSGS
jgi:hypothetical protein